MNATASRVNDVGHVLVDPSRGLPAGHVADPADAVDDRLVVAVARLQLEQVGVRRAGRLVADRLAVTDPDRVARVEADDVVAPDEHAGHAVAGRRHDEGVVEADLQRARLDRAVPVDRAGPQPEVPLADDPRRVARPLQHRGQGLAPRLDDEGGVAGEDARPLPSPGVFARQQGVAGRRAGRRRRVRVGEPQALPRQPVDVRRADPRRPVTPDVAVAQVVGIDEDDVRPLGGGRQARGQDRHEREDAARPQHRRVIRVGPGDRERSSRRPKKPPLGFPEARSSDKIGGTLPGGETVSQQVLVLFFQVRILAG